MTCECGYDNTPLEGERRPEKCGGCGVPLRPADDHSPPAPGHEVPWTEYHQDSPNIEHDNYVVDYEDREKWPELEGVLVIHELTYSSGRGIGCEPYGYYVTSKEVTRLAEEPCETCGSIEERSSYSSNGVVSAGEVKCIRCNHIKERHAP